MSFRTQHLKAGVQAASTAPPSQLCPAPARATKRGAHGKGTHVKTLNTLLIAALLCIAAPLSAQVNDTYVIPAAANQAGGFGTRWLTQFSVFNPQLDHDLNVAVVFIPTGGARGIEKLITVPANTSRYSDDILGDLFGVTGTGALLVATFPEDNPGVPNDILSRSFLLNSNTYNDDVTGTYGQTIPGIWTGLQDYDDPINGGISAIAHDIRNLAREGWRTNIGAVNLSDRNVTMYVTVYNEDGDTILNRAPFGIPPMAHMQDRLPIEVEHGAIEFFVADPARTAVVFPYVSTIDQYSGDPTYQTPTLLANTKTLYGKGRVAPQQLGKKITLEEARIVRSKATQLGVGALKGTTRPRSIR